ncbi:hypothetical protein [Paenibacillus polymyxa]|uniref:DNA-binding protein n=1 Tax=Paenibacillus polymyxa (strain SC2) TaxID=886882 RepID=E3EK46_PAEPS|nr:hypothetical protein [Paenibacillus polymyxa]ADO59755.1 hypothetical protein PPSC2_26405 [Paenibacillus polymyxa SC2]WPQ60012.1 hypothetical protein SKN87_27600 [Paenibacillus polymyxa]
MSYLDFDEIDDLDVLAKLLKMSYSLDDWNKVIELSEKLNQCSLQQLNEKTGNQINLKRPLIYYCGYSNLMKSEGLQKIGKYQEALKYIDLYRDMNWYGSMTPQEAEIANDFKNYAKANTLTIKVLQGDHIALTEYVDYLKEHPKEILCGLTNVARAATYYQWDIDNILSSFPNYITNFDSDGDTVKNHYYIDLLYMIALYRFTRQEYVDAIDYTLLILESALTLKEHNGYKKSTALFQMFHSKASLQQVNQYTGLMQSILEEELRNEKNLIFDGVDIRPGNSSHNANQQ